MKNYLEDVMKYCSGCDDKYQNHNDCQSIKLYGLCVFCIKEAKEVRNKHE